MTSFVMPKGVREELVGHNTRCSATIDQKIRCEQMAGHRGRHTSGLLVWHEPPLILVGDPPSEPNLDADTVHWRDGEVVFSEGFGQ